jgi:hypothetical protein
MARKDDHIEERGQDAPWRTAPEVQIDLFCDEVRADPALQEALHKLDDPEQFITLVLTAARDRGFALGSDDVRVAMQPHLSGLPPSNADDCETQLPPEGWLPSGTFWRNRRLFVRWAFFGERRLTEPFFEGDVQRATRKPFNRLIRYATPIDRLAEWLRDYPGLQPNGFIFHMSRCGSTLVSQMLATLAGNVVVSEASPIDAVVRAPQMLPGLSADQHVRWLRSTVSALGQRRAGDEHNYFIKLDSWHTLALPLFQRAFPDVPWIFMYRDPVEVLVSQLRIPGWQMVPGAVDPILLGSPSSDGALNPQIYRAHVLARVCEPVLEHHGAGKSLLINYRQLPEALWTAIMPHFGVAYGDHDRDAMAWVARYDAKSPSFEFSPDSEAKQQEATAAVRAVADERIGEIYRRLEVLRGNP